MICNDCNGLTPRIDDHVVIVVDAVVDAVVHVVDVVVGFLQIVK